MPIRLTLAVVILSAGIASAATPAWEQSKNTDIAPAKGRVGIKVTAGRLEVGALACPEPGLLRMTIVAKDPDMAMSRAANMGCFDLKSGDRIEIVDRMPMNDEPASHLCVKAAPKQQKCIWILNVGIKAD